MLVPAECINPIAPPRLPVEGLVFVFVIVKIGLLDTGKVLSSPDISNSVKPLIVPPCITSPEIKSFGNVSIELVPSTRDPPVAVRFKECAAPLVKDTFPPSVTLKGAESGSVCPAHNL